ncbi:MAG: hypothetical protein GF347_00480, partial [Candidatus Moranbacteria bacterium]|nr:hypothetical protein [Candidatus Moranbacteria bacterium]
TTAEELVKKHVEQNTTRWNANNAALVTINPRTGDILTMVGSRDYFDSENDGNVNVAIRGNQPGSSFKPFAYATAFSKGYTPQTLLFDVETNFKVEDYEKDYIPQNYDGKFNGKVTMREALARSLNVPAVKTLYLAGIDETLKTAESMGISTLTDRKNYGLALVLGSGNVTLLEETAAFGVFANDGVKLDHRVVLKIQDSKGNIIREAETQSGKRVLAQQVARQINDCLQDNSARSPTFGGHSPLYISGKNVAAKTGTTQEYRDAWTVGYTPELVVGVWAGNNYNEPMKEGAGGVAVAAPLWNDFMKRFIDQYSGTDFKKPKEEEIEKPMLGGFLEDEIELRIDEDSGYIATEDCKDKHIDKEKFQVSNTILYYVDIEDPRGEIPEDPEEDPQYENWEKAVQKYAQKHKIKNNPPPMDIRACEGKLNGDGEEVEYDEDDDDDDDD